MRTPAMWFGLAGVLFLAVGLILGVARAQVAGHTVWPGLVMLIGMVCILVWLGLSGALRQDDGRD